ncbi:MAG TPA: hypothetical protein VEV17_21105 [Bryobacteraceae bacterium]|nr:hypothetical protein [Bryobacteraceae bacterium]
MKKHLLRISMLAALAAGVTQAQSAELKANVPFSFMLGKQALPAGTYHVDQSKNSNLVIVHSTGGPTVPITVIRATSSSTQEVSKLVFHRYGDRYFLAEIWTRGSDNGWRLSRTSLERELAARRSIAGAQVLVALR